MPEHIACMNHLPPFRRLATAALLGLTATAQAHPGHALFEHGPLHTVASPFHLAILALIGAGVFAGALLVRQQIPRRALQTIGVLALVGSAVLWGLRG